MERAIIYARVSSKDQTRGYSLTTQIEAMEVWAAELGLEVVAQFQDGVSGKDLDREGIDAAREMLKQGEADTLLVYAHDRLSRDEVDALIIENELRKLGINIGITKDRRFVGSTTLHRIPDRSASLFAQIELENVVERSARGRRAKILSGKFNGGNPPYGYSIEGSKRDMQLIINEEEAKVVRLIFTWYAYGDDQKGTLSTIQIARRLTTLGIPKPSVSRNKTHRTKTDNWTAQVIYTVLNQSSHNGVFYHYRKKGKGNILGTRPREDWVGVPVPRIVDTETWEAAQARLVLGREKSPRRLKYEYLVGRRFRCICEYGLVSKCASRKGNHGKVYRWFYCQCRQAEPYRGEQPCKFRIKTSLVDPAVWAWIRSILLDPDALERKFRERQIDTDKRNIGLLARRALLLEAEEEAHHEVKRLATASRRAILPKKIS